MTPTDTVRHGWPRLALLYTARAVAFAFVLLLVLAALLEFGMCRNEVVATALSPDTSHRVTVFQRDCGATTDFSTQITLDPMLGQRPIGPGNLWIADARDNAAPRAYWGGPHVRVEWTSNSDLKVTHHPAARVFRAETGISGIRVTYEEVASVAAE